MQFLKFCRVGVAAFALAGLATSSASAQYFGQNKVQYRSFDFQIIKTEHFDLYYYPEEEAAARDAARMAERWYDRFSAVLEHDLSSRQPVILYASHPHFEQTNVIEGALGEGTGGVTESLKRRIVMPVGAGPAATDHVLGHEIVHAFQYDILGPQMSLPLWFIEGMAEYLSLGSVDSHTAIWLRDAAIAEKLPEVDELSHPRYFPYRFGHAFWAYVGGRWGDGAVSQILHAAANRRGGNAGGLDPISLIESVLGLDDTQLTQEWHAAILTGMVRPLGTRRTDAGRRIIEPGDENELSIGPVLNRDGSRIAFLSSRDRLSIDLFVADATTGRVERKIISTAANPHFDSLQFISSAGTWNPSGSKLAVAAVREGRPVIAIVDANTGDRDREYALPDVDEAFNPAWSPDGRSIAFSGLSGGWSDLYLLDPSNGGIRRLTRDAFADFQPAWSPDGRRLVFSTDRFSSNLDTLQFGEYELGIVEVVSGQPSRLVAFEGARHISPQWSRDGWIYFIANPDGVPDVYRMSAQAGTASRITRLMTGVTGITATSPALTLAADGNRLAAVVYRNSTYEIQAIEGAQLAGAEAAPARATLAAARLAPTDRGEGTVDRILSTPGPGPVAAEAEPYRPRLSLDAIGQEFGVSTGHSLSGYVGGGIALTFSDMLGDHAITSVVQVNGTFEDIGGQVGYLNRRNRWNWGTFLEQIPYTTGGVFGSVQNINGQNVLVEREVRDRQIDRRVLAIAAYPFSRARRFEVGGSVRHLTFTRDIDTRVFSISTGRELEAESDRIPLGDPLTLGQLSTAFVQDTTAFGPTGPILGHRSRFAVSPAWGDLQFTSLVADVRHYVMPVRPFTIAGRFLHISRLGRDGESLRLSPLYLGYPNLVRGYDIGSFDFDECGITSFAGCDVVNQMIGSRLLLAGVELRAPIVGLFTRNLDYGPIPAEWIAFYDTGVAWDSRTRPSGFSGGTRPWVRSFGTGARVNVLGYLILELVAVRALDRPQDDWRFVFGIRPGY